MVLAKAISQNSATMRQSQPRTTQGISRKLASNDNILYFPKSDNSLFQSAVETYGQGKYEEALAQCIQLIDNGYGHANTLAGAIYEKGGAGVTRDYEKALFYYQKAVDDVGAVEGWLALGRFYYFGKGIKKDHRNAFEKYSVVAEETDNPVAWLMLGRLYREGEGIEKNLGKAREYFDMAADKGYVFAVSQLSLLEGECGNYLKSIWLRCKAVYLGKV